MSKSVLDPFWKNIFLFAIDSQLEATESWTPYAS